MTIPSSVKSRVSEAEWAARQELAACYRIFDLLGWTELLYNHITLRVPGEDRAFLINPYGLHFSEVTASNLVKIDIDGNKLDDNPWPVNIAGFTQHSAFHRHLPEAHCVIHTHTTAGMAVSSTLEGLRPGNFYSIGLTNMVAYHDFEGITVRPEEMARLLDDLGGRRFMLLRNHGILVMGGTVPETFLYHWVLQRACEVQIATRTAGTPIEVSPEVIAVHQRDLLSSGIVDRGQAEFAAMVRRLERVDTGWRE